MLKNQWILWISIALFSTSVITACGGDSENNSENDADEFTCTDGEQNGSETGVDCGGDCTACEIAPTCSDNEQNGSETGVDCGGICAACEIPSTCNDGEQNGTETGIDCGGACNACEIATCTDGEQNGSETGIDCGGACEPCETAPTCNDGEQNGSETGIDCGGSCEPCETAPTCNDGEQNGSETGIDCGGSCEPCSSEDVCDSIPVASNAGISCDSAEDCENESVCIDGTCLQLCSPDNCEDFCSATEACQGLINQDGTPATLPNSELPAGACFDVSNGAGAFEACSPDPCQAGLECSAIEEGATVGTCFPQCGGGVTCPTVEGFASECILITEEGADPSICAIQCTPDDNSTCPTGRVCIPMGESGVCGNRPEGTCTDGEQNGSETGIDCGGSCEPCSDEPCSDDWDSCTSEDQSNNDFVCDVTNEICLRRCDSRAADDTMSEDCLMNSWCFPLTNDPNSTEGACMESDCDSIFDGCEISDAAGTCLPIGHGASFCINGGTAGIGDDCGGDVSCSAGLLCGPEQTCFEPCNLDEDDIGADCGDLDCVEAVDNTASNPVGICGDGCGKFSEGECEDGFGCQIMLGRGGLNDSLCLEIDGDPVADGETCNTTSIPCMEGSICLNQGTEDAPVLVCTQLCDTTFEENGTLATCVEGEVCQPSAIDNLGFCSEGCDPYPRQGAGNYGCDEPGDTCYIFNFDLNEWDDAVGSCMAPFDNIEYGASCGGADMMYRYCGSDLGVCYDSAETNPTCRAFCAPFGGNDACEGDAVCDRVFAFGGDDFGMCNSDFLSDTAQGSECGEATGSSCADGTTCLATQSGTNLCQGICRIGHDEDCPSGTACGAAPFQVPDYMGLCQ